MEDPKTEPEPFNKRLLTVEWIALVNQLNSEIAICKDAQVGLIRNDFYFPLNCYLQIHFVTSFRSLLYFYYLVDCKWGTWTNWDLCTRSCGGGMQGRTRAILVPERNGGKRCVGDPLEMRNCNMQPCQSKSIVSKFFSTNDFEPCFIIENFVLILI